MKLLLETIAKVCVIVILLSVFLSAGLFGFLSELFKFDVSRICKALLTCDDVHGEFFVILGVKSVHLVEHRDVLHKDDLVILQLLNDLVDVSFSLGVGSLNGFQFVFLFLEESGYTLLLGNADILKFNYQGCKVFTDASEVLGTHVV